MEIAQIKKNLKTVWLGNTTHVESTVDSTNAWALRKIREGAGRGEVFLADNQTKGHGLKGRVWESAGGKNILMTLIDTPPADPAKVFQLTLVAGVAFQEALVSLFPSLPVLLKWPNDLLVYPERGERVERAKGKKLAGILCERDSSKPMAVVGVGINVNQPVGDFSPEVGPIAASLSDELKKPQSREAVIAACLNSYEKWRNEYAQSGLGPIRSAWLKNSVMMGKKVRVVEGEKIFEGTAENLDEEGFLVVDGKRVISGDVVIL